MKKFIASILSFIFILSLAACGNENTPANETISNNDVVSETDDGASLEAYSETEVSSSENETSSDDAEWKQFLKDYEAWVDDYIEIVNKYKADPTDMSILSDYTEMVSEMATWSERADEIELELEDTNAALEYSAELLRIAGKLTEVAY